MKKFFLHREKVWNENRIETNGSGQGLISLDLSLDFLIRKVGKNIPIQGPIQQKNFIVN